MRGQMMGGMPNVGQEGERPLPVLAREPPLSKCNPMRIIGQDEDLNQEQDLVPIIPYGEDGSCSQRKEGLDWSRNPQVSYHQGQFNMDLITLMFIAGQNGMPMALKRALNLLLGLCLNGLENHVIKDCPYPRQPRQTNATLAIPTLARYCLESGIKRLVSDCPLNPKKKKKV